MRGEGVQPQSLGVRPATAADVPALSGALARAFHADPVYWWMFPDEALRRRRQPRLFSALLKLQLRHGTVLTTAGLEGAALWEPPRGGHPSLAVQIELLLRVRALFGRRSLLVARGTTNVMMARPQRPHWYLEVLGTDPAHQGKGVGTALMAPIFDLCASQGVPAYLEASREENIPYYQRHGFTVLGPIPLPKGPSVWRMMREARPS